MVCINTQLASSLPCKHTSGPVQSSSEAGCSGEDKEFVEDLWQDLTRDLKLMAFCDKLSLMPGSEKVPVRCAVKPAASSHGR